LIFHLEVDPRINHVHAIADDDYWGMKALHGQGELPAKSHGQYMQSNAEELAHDPPDGDITQSILYDKDDREYKSRNEQADAEDGDLPISGKREIPEKVFIRESQEDT